MIRHLVCLLLAGTLWGQSLDGRLQAADLYTLRQIAEKDQDANVVYRAGIELWSRDLRSFAVEAYKRAAALGSADAGSMVETLRQSGRLNHPGSSDRPESTRTPASSPVPSRRSTSAAPRTTSWIPASVEKAAGLSKLTPTERQALEDYLEGLVNVAIDSARKNAQLLSPSPSESPRARLALPTSPPPFSPSGVIESTIDGDFEGWEGETVVKLMNGQIWQQIDGHYEYTYEFMPKVLIYQSGAVWKMKVEGSDDAVMVRRLR